MSLILLCITLSHGRFAAMANKCTTGVPQPPTPECWRVQASILANRHENSMRLDKIDIASMHLLMGYTGAYHTLTYTIILYLANKLVLVTMGVCCNQYIHCHSNCCLIIQLATHPYITQAVYVYHRAVLNLVNSTCKYTW